MPDPMNLPADSILYLLACLSAYLIAINLLAWHAFGLDKRCAMRGDRRIPERRLLLLALLGGSPGALLARRHFRHKTRKQPFSALLMAIVGIQAGALIMFLLLLPR